MASPPDKLYVDVPHLVSRRRKLGDAIATGFMWIVYSYLWAPLISLIAWLLGFEFAYNVMIRLGGLSTLRSVMTWYGIMIFSIMAVVMVWSAFNRVRYAGRNRRTTVAPVTDGQIAEFFEVSDRMLSTIRDAKAMRMRLSDTATVENIEPCEVTSDDAPGYRGEARISNR